MKRANLLICIAVALLFVGFWAALNRPENEPPWPEKIQGFSFSPMRAWNDPAKHDLPSEAEIEQDLALLAGKTNAIRTYSVEGVFARIPELARRYGLNVTLGAWLDGDIKSNEEQIETVIRLARKNYHNVIRVIVGNETLLRGDLSMAQLIGYIDRVQSALRVPVSTAEPWDIWIKNPSLAEHVDFVAVHMLPYWEGINLNNAVGHVVNRYEFVAKTFPDKPIVIGEVGWPSNGRTFKSAVASPANEATFLRRFLSRAEELDYVYYVMEAFDQPWKMRKNNEGAVGAYWGVYNVEREPKFAFTKPVVEIPEWHLLAAISISISAIIFMLLVIDSKALRVRGRGFLASIAFLAATGTVWVVYSYSRQYLTTSTILVGLVMIVGLIGAVIVILAEAHEWAEAMWGAQYRHVVPIDNPDEELLPFVSIHVPTYNEPAAMVIETLQALVRLDYPRYEVIVIDNNTSDPAVWQPVAAYCESLGPKFHFFHEDRLEGFKAGALNYALARTASESEVVAVIDSDYVVEPNWLRDLAQQFLRPEIAIVQAPQDYRDDGESLFKGMCYAEYQAFFSIGMIIRNERNAIIQHGTMTMVRKTVLEKIDGWAPWCITEDAELGLRIFAKGHEALYVPKCYGRGLMPDTFVDFKKQRFRWAYGAVQIMRYHSRALLSWRESRLTFGQRYHFIAGWLPWLADSINLIFTMAAVAWSVYMIYYPKTTDPPLTIFSLVPLSFFSFKLAKMFYLYQHRVNASLSRTTASALAGLSLTHTIAKAMLFGFVTRKLPFHRTPKRVDGSTIGYALQAAREESLIAVALLLSAYGITRFHGTGNPDLLAWVIVLVVQSIPYLAAVTMSFIAAWPNLPVRLVRATPRVASAGYEIGNDRQQQAGDPAFMTSQSSFPKGLLFTVTLGLPCLLPALFRYLQFGLSQPVGLVSDLGLGLMLFTSAALSPRWLRAVMLLFWALFYIGATELFSAIQRLPVVQDLHYLVDPTFLAGSTAGFHLAAPVHSVIMLVSVIPPLCFVARSVRSVWPLVGVSAGLFLLLVHKPMDARHASQSVVARYNPLHWIVSDVLAARTLTDTSKAGSDELPKGFTSVDLQGRRLIPAAPAGNVLIIALEGIPGIYLPDIRRAMNVTSDVEEMTGLGKNTGDAMLVPDFVAHSHQTIRGLYAMHCGDFSKLSSETPKAFELQLAPERAAECLPAQLAAHGWRTHYLQGAPLQFMNKDKSMPAMGFQEVHGLEWFTERNDTDFIWGANDEDFFKGAKKYITQLQAGKTPWLLSLLTVATHQPFAAKKTSVEKYGSRKMAAVADLDTTISGFLQWLREEKILKDTLVIITSDESHGANGADWFSSWGLGIVMPRDGRRLPHLKKGTYGLVDIEASVLDYFRLPMPPSIIGRSLFRDYPSGRDMITNTAGKIRWQTAEGDLYECSRNGSCQFYPDTNIIGLRPDSRPSEEVGPSARIFSVAATLDDSLVGESNRRVLQFAKGEIRKLPEKVRNEWTDNLIGAQYLDFPKGSKVRVDIKLRAVSAPDAGVRLRLVMRQFEKEVTSITRPAFPLLHRGESASITFSFENPTARQAFSFHLVGEGRDAAIQIDQFQLTIVGPGAAQ